MAKPVRSIRARLTLGALALVAVVLIVASVAGVLLLRSSLTDGIADALRQDLDTISTQLERGPASVDGIDDDMLVRLQGRSLDTNDEDAEALPSVSEDVIVRAEIDGEAHLVTAEDTEHGRLTIARSLESVDEAVAVTSVVLAVAVPLVLVLVGAVMWAVASRALAPVERLRSQVDAIDASGLERRVDAGRDDELGSLARTMNRMLDRIEQAQTTQRRFVSDASHELRSPLATIRQHAELAQAHPRSITLAGLSEVVLDEGARMQELVEGLLLLARLGEGRHGVWTPTDMDDLALSEAHRLRGMGVEVDARGIGPGRVEGDTTLLSRAVRNLVDNAARHARNRVTIRVLDRDGWVLLQVEDDGAGIPADQREQVFDRFTRLDAARARDAGGSGLGLAIVREVTGAHGGEITVHEAPSGGALFSLALPSAAQA